MRLQDYFAKGLVRGEHRAAFVDDNRTLTWGEVDRLGRRLGSAMHESGVSDCPPVAVYSPNDAMAFVCIIGAFFAGGVWVPANARNPIASNAHFMRLAHCECLFYHSSFAEHVAYLRETVPSLKVVVCIDRADGGNPSLEEFASRATGKLPEVPDVPDRTATIFPTGGTTGLSKGAHWTHSTWEALIGAYWMCLPSEEPPVHLVAGPMTHAAGGLALMMMPGGATNVVLSKADPELIMRAIEKHRVTHLYLPPTVLYMMLAHPEVRRYNYSSLKYFVLAAAPVAPEKFREALDVFGPVMCQSFGQAEAPMFLTYLSTADLLAARDSNPKLFASCGRATTNVRVEILDAEGNVVPPGVKGEIAARGSLVFKGYFENPKATSEATVNGWHKTGDVGYKDEDGFFYIVDRVKDMIVTGGFNVFSVEIEQVLLSHPAVRDCAVIGVPDSKWGEAVKAVVELKTDSTASESDLMALVRRELGPVHTPKSVEFWSQLPRSGNGKVLKREIRDQFWEGHARAI